jgi:hypothetical protein
MLWWSAVKPGLVYVGLAVGVSCRKVSNVGAGVA